MNQQQFNAERDRQLRNYLPIYKSQALDREHGLHRASSKRSVRGKAAGVHFRGKEFRIVSAKFI